MLRWTIAGVCLGVFGVEVVAFHETGELIFTAPLWLLFPTAWAAIGELSGGAGAFLGAFVGLMAILLGAIFNAHLDRSRDARVRREEATAIASALLGEIQALSNITRKRDYINIVISFAESMKRGEDPGLPKINASRKYNIIFEKNADKIGFLPPPLPQNIAYIYVYINSILEGFDTIYSGDYDDKPNENKIYVLDNLAELLEHVSESADNILIPQLCEFIGICIEHQSDGSRQISFV